MQNFSQEFLSEYEIVDDLERTEAQSQIGQTWCRKRIAIKKVFDYFGEPTTAMECLKTS